MTGVLEQVGWFWRYNANDDRPDPSEWWFTKAEPSPGHCEMWDISVTPAYRTMRPC